MLKDISTGLAVIGIIMTLFHKRYPHIAAWGVPIGLIGLLGITYL
ncbi:MAG: hypothetical protein AABW81_00730 [Nanoarchaeota archaeon]